MTRRLGQLATHKLAAGIAVGILALGGVAVVGASGGASDAAGNASDVLAALHVTDRTPDQADEHLDAIGQEDADDEAADEAAPEGSGHEGSGIGNSNASETGLDHANENAFDGAANADDKGDNRNTDLPEQANEHATEGGAGAAELPDQADDHASDGAGNERASEHVPEGTDLPFD